MLSLRDKASEVEKIHSAIGLGACFKNEDTISQQVLKAEMVVSPFGTPVLLLGIVTIFHLGGCHAKGAPRTTKDYEPQTGTTALRTAAKAAPRPPMRWATSHRSPRG